MAKQTFTTGQVLTAAQMTSLQQTAMLGGAASAKTASYTLVATDAGSAISMSNASATTITVNTSLFAAGDTVQITNLGAGVCTITAGTATVNTSASLALAQYESGTLNFTSTSAAIFIKGAAAASSVGMTLINTTTIGSAVTSTSLPANTFSATYTNYRFLFTSITSTSANITVSFRLRAGGTDESSGSYSCQGFTSTGSLSNNSAVNQTSQTISYIRTGFAERTFIVGELYQPKEAIQTKYYSNSFGENVTTFTNLQQSGLLNVSTSFDSITFLYAGGNITGGKISVYGYNI
jgi:hypothetical protein